MLYYSRLLSIAILLLLVLSFISNGQEPCDSTVIKKEQLGLDEIIVTAERTPVQSHFAGRIVGIISAEDIKIIPAQCFGDLLEYETGMDLRQRGGIGVQMDAGICGSSFEQILILLNGINLNDPQTGHHNMNLPVDPGDISRIEILKGSGSRSFGTNAFGGVVNIITKLEKTAKATVNLSTGDFGFRKTLINLKLPVKSSLNSFSASHQQSDGYIYNTDYRITNIFYHNRIEAGTLNLEFQTGLTSKDFGANSFYSPKYPEQYERIRTLFTSINLRKVSGMATISSNIYWRRNQDQFALFRNHIPQWYKSDNYHQTNVIGGGCNFSLTSDYGIISSGIDIRSEKILSNILGEPLSEPLKVPWNDTVEFIKGHTRFHNGVFIEYSTDFRKLHISLGSMAAFNSDNNNKITLYPGFDLNYKISNRLMLYGSINRALRMPSFTELYYSSPVIRGNRELFPEKAISLESGLKFFNREIKAHLSLFRRSGSDIIDWVKYPADSIWTAMNHTSIDVTGIEFNFIWRPSNVSDKRNCLNYFRIGYGYLGSNKMSGEMQSRYILDHLRHKTDAGINWKIAEVINFSLLMSYQQRAGRYQPFENEIYLTERPFPPVFLVDGKISMNLKSISFFAEATNILDLRYFDYANVPLPGRWLKAGAVVDLNLKKSVVKEKIPDRNISFN